MHRTTPTPGKQALRAAAGYLLVETLVSMAVLSVSMLAIHGALRNGIRVHGEAQDYTTVRFLMGQIAAEHELQPELVEGEETGEFPGDHSRFTYEWKVTKQSVPKPTLPPDISAAQRAWFDKSFKEHIGKLYIKITWSRGGMPLEAIGETLLRPDQLWLPPEYMETP